MYLLDNLNKSNFLKLKELISNDEVLLLPHKKYKRLIQVIFYARCSNQKFFEKAYKNKELVLQFGKSGPRVGHPLSWEEALYDYLNNKI